MADFLDYMIEDEHTSAVMLFCEAVRNGPAFVAALAKARRLGKPVIAIKVGRSDAGTRASASHTASLSGSYTAYHAVFERYGVIEAEDPDEAVAIAGVMLSCPLPKGRRVGIVTVSGGGGAWTADTMSAHGLIVPQLSAAEQARLRPLMPSYGAAGNPVDVTAQGSNTGPAMMTAMEHLAESDEIDMLLLVSSLASTTRASLDAARIRAVAAKCGKPMTVWTYTLPSEFGRNASPAADYSCTAICAPAAWRSANWPITPRRWRGRCRSRSIRCRLGWNPVCRRSCRSIRRSRRWRHGCRPPPNGWSYPPRPPPMPPRPGFPGRSESAIGRSAAQDRGRRRAPEPARPRRGHAACTAMLADVVRHKPEAKIDGVLVQKMAPKGHELVIGMVNDPTFGPIMMVGYGGTTVELFGDVVHAPAPVDEAEATRMILALKSARLLTGFRGSAPIDLAPVAKLVAALSRAALTLREQVAEFELNPVILHADGSGLTVADALLTLRGMAGAATACAGL